MVRPEDWVCSHSHCSNLHTDQAVTLDQVELSYCEDADDIEADVDTPGDSHDEDNVGCAVHDILEESKMLNVMTVACNQLAWYQVLESF